MPLWSLFLLRGWGKKLQTSKLSSGALHNNFCLVFKNLQSFTNGECFYNPSALRRRFFEKKPENGGKVPIKHPMATKTTKRVDFVFFVAQQVSFKWEFISSRKSLSAPKTRFLPVVRKCLRAQGRGNTNEHDLRLTTGPFKIQRFVLSSRTAHLDSGLMILPIVERWNRFQSVSIVNFSEAQHLEVPSDVQNYRFCAQPVAGKVTKTGISRSERSLNIKSAKK